MNTNEPTPAKAPLPLWKRLLFRLALIAVITTVFTLILDHTSESATELKPAGFAKGLLHGALMPGAMPRLLIGHDVTIYAENNTGRTYKLGYTAGVNGCGALFFGFWYWRLNRWRKKRKAESKDTNQ